MTKMMPDLEGYFRGLAPDSDALLLELEAEATRESIPIVGPVVGELLFVLARATGAKTILELGTATGYSGIFLGRACARIPGRVISLELDECHGQPGPGQLRPGRAHRGGGGQGGGGPEVDGGDVGDL